MTEKKTYIVKGFLTTGINDGSTDASSTSIVKAIIYLPKGIRIIQSRTIANYSNILFGFNKEPSRWRHGKIISEHEDPALLCLEDIDFKVQKNYSSEGKLKFYRGKRKEKVVFSFFKKSIDKFMNASKIHRNQRCFTMRLDVVYDDKDSYFIDSINIISISD